MLRTRAVAIAITLMGESISRLVGIPLRQPD
jgi:hypothetical protein